MSVTAENRAFKEKQTLVFLPKISEAWYVDKDTKLRHVQEKVCQTRNLRRYPLQLPGRGGGCGRVWSSGHARAVAETAAAVSAVLVSRHRA